MTNQLILASSSPRRRELLEQVNIPFSIRQPETDESQITTDDPFDKVKQLAILKGRETPRFNANEVILAADTVVSYRDEIFEKPKSEQDAYRMLSLLGGNTHDVLTGVMIRSVDKEIIFVERTEVEFWPLSDADINRYIQTIEPYDKAGAYGIQSRGAMFVKEIHGDYFTIVGLPLSRVCRELKALSIYPNR